MLLLSARLIRIDTNVCLLHTNTKLFNRNSFAQRKRSERLPVSTLPLAHAVYRFRRGPIRRLNGAIRVADDCLSRDQQFEQ